MNAEPQHGESSNDWIMRLVREACSAWADMPRHEQLRLERESKISWVAGQMALVNGAHQLSREVIGKIVDDYERSKGPGGNR